MTTTTPTFTKDISYCRFTKDYSAKVDGNLIGFFATHREAEIAADEYALELLTSGLHIPAQVLGGTCGDCGQTLDAMGLCGCQAEEHAPPDESKPVPLAKHLYVIYDAAIYRFICRWRQNDEDSGGYTSYPDFASCQKWADWIHFPIIYFAPAELASPADTSPSIVETPRYTVRCICGAVGVIVHPDATYCGGCHEAADLWAVWKTDSTAFIAELRHQSSRLNEMAVRVATYLNAKNGSAIGADSILAMWRQLLDDGGPEPRYYVVGRPPQEPAPAVAVGA